MKKVYYICAIVLLVALFSYFFIDKSLALFFKYDFTELDRIFNYITKLGKSEFYLIVSFLLFASFYKKNSFIKRASLLIFSSIAVSGIITNLIKPIVARYRPKALFEDGLFGFSGFDIGYIVNSFPSGHSATSFSLFISLSLLFPKYRYIFYILAFLVAFSRVVITAHYLSDTIVGSLIGALCAIYFYKKFFAKNCVVYGDNSCR